MAVLAAVRYRNLQTEWRDQLVLLAPAVVLFVMLSSQTGFSRYLRYALPIAPFCHIWIGQAARAIAARRTAASWAVVFGAVLAVTSSLAAFPHSLSYFNEIVGGPLHGADHLLDANIDWGQDVLFLKRWYDAHPEARPFFLQNFGYPADAPQLAGIESRPMPRIENSNSPGRPAFEPSLEPGWYAISVNDLYGYRHVGSEKPWFSYLRAEKPVARAGYSISIYYLSAGDVARLTSDGSRGASKFSTRTN
jgi:hypothetical protein